MNENWDLELAARYGARLLADTRLRPPHLRDVLVALGDHREGLRAAIPHDLWAAALASRGEAAAVFKQFSPAWKTHSAAAIKMLAALGKSAKGAKPVKRNIATLAGLAGLDKAERKILLALVAYRSSATIESACDEAGAARLTPQKLVSIMTGLEPNLVAGILGPAGSLVRTGLISYDADSGYLDSRYVLRRGLAEALADSDFSEDHLRGHLLGEVRRPSLALADFDHMAHERDFCVSLLAAAARAGQRGINFLFYGPPGCGKTEFAAAIALAAGLALHAAGDGRLSKGEQKRADRLSDLVLHVNLLRSGGAAILFDEIEDVAFDLIDRGGSKLHLNRVLESNAVPVLWTSNTLRRIDPALVRRMTHVVAFRHPPAPHRARLWRAMSESNGLDLTVDRAADLGHRFDASPAVIQSAVRAAKLSGDERALDHVTRGLSRALGHRERGGAASGPAFDAALAKADRDLEAFASAIAARGDTAMSFCFSGPPGTGKSAYARHLAERLGLEAMEMRASDLMSTWVGETERLIAEAFREARERRAFLVFDEADSLLHDRTRSRASWEVSQVNEMLTWMESHPLPFCCTTNLADRLDPASLRRFVFDIRFAFLDGAGLARAWTSFFPEAGPPPALCLGLANLTPGDFAKLRRRAEILAETRDGLRLLAALEEANRAKPGAVGMLGFRAAAE